jgi:hypothetical protein
MAAGPRSEPALPGRDIRLHPFYGALRLWGANGDATLDVSRIDHENDLYDRA